MAIAAGDSREGRLLRLVLAGSVAVVMALPLGADAQGGDVVFLDANGVPKAGFESTAPAGPLVNLDPHRDDGPGLLLVETSGGAGEADPTKHQLWSGQQNTIPLQGTASLILTAAMADFSATARGRINAYLQDCKSNLRDCTTVSSASVSRQPWSAGGSWATVTFGFGPVDHELVAGRKLVVRVTVDAGSDGDMRIAYDAADYPSRLIVMGGSTTTTTTTTSTTSAPTTTTTAATTTTRATTTTTSTTRPVTTSSSTTVAPAATTATTPSSVTPPTTTTPAPRATVPQTTTTAGAGTPVPPTNPPPAASGSPDPPDGGGGEVDTSEVTSTSTGRLGAGTTREIMEIVEPPTHVIAQPLEGIAPPVSSAPGSSLSPVGEVITVVELVLPDPAARVALSPVVIADVLIGAMFRTGLGISLPAAGAGLIVGLLTITAERRLTIEGDL